MEKYYAFQLFDPMHGIVPHEPILALPEVAHRARSHLSGRSSKQVSSAALTVDWLLDEYRETSVLPHLHGTDQVDEAVALSEWLSSRAIEDEEFPEGRPSEYLAVLALMEVALAIGWVRARHEPAYAGTEAQIMLMSMIGNAAMTAMDAACRAEQLVLDAEMEQQAALLGEVVKHKERISMSNSKNAIIGHAEHHSMKRDAFSWFMQNRGWEMKVDKAAEGITKQVKIAFSTAQKWVREFRKIRSAGTR